jgi:large subunit ribosomal protein L29
MAITFDTMLDWSPEERAAKEKEWTQSLFTLRLQKATGQLENPMRIREVRKDLARLKTAVRAESTPKSATAKGRKK